MKITRKRKPRKILGKLHEVFMIGTYADREIDVRIKANVPRVISLKELLNGKEQEMHEGIDIVAYDELCDYFKKKNGKLYITKIKIDE